MTQTNSPTPDTSNGGNWPKRPAGELIWCHATTEERLFGLCDVAERLKSLRPDLRVLATWEPDTNTTHSPLDCDIPFGPLALDTPGEIRIFLDHWTPDVSIWAGGVLRRSLMRKMRERSMPTVLVDIEETELPSRKTRFLPDQRHRLLNGFSAIILPNERVARRMRGFGVEPQRISVSGSLRLSSSPPECNDDDLNVMQAQFGSRPVWLAARVSLGDLDAVVTAHRAALRYLHRLLLIISMNDPTDVPKARDLLRQTGLGMVIWDEGEDPSEHDQILLGGPEDLGLWYRLAPLTFMAGSLQKGAAGHNPLDAAALGSALIFGPGVVEYDSIYQRLESGAAARKIVSATTLGEAVIDLSAPDKAAEMALAGWTLVTEGAATTDLLIGKIQSLLDESDTRNA